MAMAMALAEARAAWQRTANRFLVQEDAKRAPKLACCPSMRPSTNPASDLSNPIADSIKPFDQWSSWCSNLSPNSKLWLQKQPNYQRQHKAMVSELLDSMEDKKFLVDQAKFDDSSGDVLLFRNSAYADKKEILMRDRRVEEVDDGVLQNDDVKFYLEYDKDCGPCLDPSKSDREKSSPRWRTADAEELALLVAQSSIGQVENCDLPWPRNNGVKKDLNGVGSLSVDRSSYRHGVGRVCKDPKLPLENQTRAGGDGFNKTRHGATHVFDDDDDDESKARILEALRHSQTRAREAEKAAKLVRQEKEQVLTLLFRQASQIFVYKQWLHHLELENTNLLLRVKKGQPSSSMSFVSPIAFPRKPQNRGRKLTKGHL